MVRWDTVTRPRKFGGLLVRKSREQNVALLGKLVWEIKLSQDKLWVQVLQVIYLSNDHILVVKKKEGSSTGSAITKALDILQEGFKFKIGSGDTNI